MTTIPRKLALTAIPSTRRTQLLQMVIELAREGKIVFTRRAKGFTAHEGEFSFRLWKEQDVHSIEFKGPNTPPIVLRSSGGSSALEFHELLAIIAWREENIYAPTFSDDLGNHFSKVADMKKGAAK